MRFRALPALVLVLSTAGCHSWHTQSAPAPDVVARQNGGGAVRVQRHDRSTLILFNPQVVGDSIVGQAGNPPQRAAVAVADVERIDTRGVSAAKTGGLTVGVLALAAVVAVGVALAAFLSDWH